MKTLNATTRCKTLLAHSFTMFTLLATLWACGQDAEITPTPDESKNTISAAEYQAMRTSFNSLEGEWLLTAYQNATLPQHLQNKSSLHLVKKSADVLQMGGTSFINHYGGQFTLDETKGLVVLKEPIMQTLIGASEELLQAETQFLNGLEKVTSFELTDAGQLKLYQGEKGNPTTEVMIFVKK